MVSNTMNPAQLELYANRLAVLEEALAFLGCYASDVWHVALMEAASACMAPDNTVMRSHVAFADEPGNGNAWVEATNGRLWRWQGRMMT